MGDIHYNELPTLEAILDRGKQTECRLLFEEMAALEIQKAALEDRMEEIKLTLEQFQYMVDAPGIRHEDRVFIASEVKGRKILDTILLIENGCPKQALKDSYRQSPPHIRRLFTRF